MKCQFVVDVDVELSTMAEDAKKDVKWKPHPSKRVDGIQKLEPYFPAGTIYDHDNAAHFVDVGCAIPADAECEQAAKPLSKEQRARLELEYKANALGILDKHDRELFFAGVIAGYEPVGGSGRMAYKPGPNYATWKAAQDKLKQTAESDV